MNQQFLAHISRLTMAEFKQVFGPGSGMLLWPSFVNARDNDTLQAFLITLTDDESKHLAAYIKLKVRGACMQLEGRYDHLHKVIQWLTENALPFLIVLSEKELTPGNTDFAVMMNLADYRQFQDEQSNAA